MKRTDGPGIGAKLPPEGRPLDPALDDRPPVGGSWNRLYAAVLLFLVFQIIVYWLFTKAFS